MSQFNYKQESDALNQKHGLFYAFSSEQFEASAKPGIEYKQVMCGGFVYADSKEEFLAGQKALFKKKVQYELETIGARAITLKALSNFECFYSSELHDAIDYVAEYGISADFVVEVYQQERKIHD